MCSNDDYMERRTIFLLIKNLFGLIGDISVKI